jgi:hypothetical protein
MARALMRALRLFNRPGVSFTLDDNRILATSFAFALAGNASANFSKSASG